MPTYHFEGPGFVELVNGSNGQKILTVNIDGATVRVYMEPHDMVVLFIISNFEADIPEDVKVSFQEVKL